MNTSSAAPLPRHGERVVLRRFAATDLPAFQRYRHQPESGLYQGWLALSDPEALAFIEEMKSARLFEPGIWCQIAIAERETDELIGDIGVCVAAGQEKAEIGFTLRGESQGTGLATEAIREAISLLFEVAQVEQVVAITDMRNLRSVRLLERMGMQKAETAAAMFKGEPCVESTFVLSKRAGV